MRDIALFAAGALAILGVQFVWLLLGPGRTFRKGYKNVMEAAKQIAEIPPGHVVGPLASGRANKESIEKFIREQQREQGLTEEQEAEG